MTSFKKLVISGSLLEMYEYERQVAKGVYRPQRVRQRVAAPFKQRRANNLRAVKKTFMRRVLSTVKERGSPLFLTLTYKSKEDSLTNGYKDLRRFILRLRRVYGDVQVVSVPEFQKRGAVHYHLFVWGLPAFLADIRHGSHLLKRGEERATRVLAELWGQGFLDCVVSDGNIKHVAYFAKYMSKALQDKRLVGRKAYYMTRGICFPTELRDEQVDFIFPKLQTRLISEYNIKSMWLGLITIKRYER